MLAIRGVTKDFAGVRALNDVTFTLRAGEIHALCGENGAGKSTLLKILTGVHPAGSFAGQVEIGGEPVRLTSLASAERRGLALIAQELALAPDLTVEENIVLGHEPVRRGVIDRAAMRRTALDALARAGLAVAPETPVRDLGIGQQQLVEIAKALAKNAAILMLDEPTAALTDADAARLLDLLRELARGGVACLYVSHRLDEVFRVADRVTVLRDGRTVASAPANEWTRAHVVAQMVGRDVAEAYPRAAAPRAPVALRVRGWTLDDPRHAGRRALDGISFDVREGEVLGLGGLMGAGRTALLTSLFGAARAAVRGELTLAGDAPRPPFRTPAAAIAAGCALVVEDRKSAGVLPTGDVADNLTLAYLRHLTRGGLLDATRRDEAAAEQVATLRIRTASLRAPIGALSGGNQQKTLLGRGLLTRPRVLLLDEPTRGVDVGARAEIYAHVAALAAQGMAIVLATSDLPELLGVSHRVVVLAGGRAVTTLEGDALTPEAVMHAATAAAGAAA